jgi:hypothetical protein
MTRATEIVELRALGLGLVEIGRARQLHETVQRIRKLRTELDRGTMSVASVVSNARRASDTIGVAISLPWPWGGERLKSEEYAA